MTTHQVFSRLSVANTIQRDDMDISQRQIWNAKVSLYYRDRQAVKNIKLRHMLLFTTSFLEVMKLLLLLSASTVVSN